MNSIEFENKIKGLPTTGNQSERRQSAKNIVRELFLQDGVTAGIFRDKEDLMDCQLEAILMRTETCIYLWMDFMEVGAHWRFSQLEKINSDVSSTILFTTYDDFGNVGCQTMDILDKMCLVTAKK